MMKLSATLLGMAAVIGGALLLTSTSPIEQHTEADRALIVPKAIDVENVRVARIDESCSDPLETFADQCDFGVVEIEGGAECLCWTTSVAPLTGEISDVSTLPASRQYRLVGCCEGEQKSVRWQVTTDPVGNCLTITNPSLHSRRSSRYDLGLAALLNDSCCDPGESVAKPGMWGNCPQCMYGCNVAGNPFSTPNGCDAFCAVTP